MGELPYLSLLLCCVCILPPVCSVGYAKHEHFAHSQRHILPLHWLLRGCAAGGATGYGLYNVTCVKMTMYTAVTESIPT